MCSFCYINYDLFWLLNFATLFSQIFVEYWFWTCVYCALLIKLIILIWFLYVEWQTPRVPDTRPKPDGYGYEFLPTDTGINFYPQPLCWRAGNCSTRSEPDPLPSLLLAWLDIYIVSWSGHLGSAIVSMTRQHCCQYGSTFISCRGQVTSASPSRAWLGSIIASMTRHLYRATAKSPW
jgi:hypothetical protein